MIEITRIIAQNFMQYGSLDFHVQNGLTSIIGKNRTGKSSIPEAMFWALFGETIRNQNDEPVLRRGTKEVAVAVVGAKDGVSFSIERHQKSSGTTVDLKIGGEPVNKGTTTLTQKHFEEFLGTSFQTCSSAAMFGHNSFRITRAKDAERKAIFESILPLGKYAAARQLASTTAGTWSNTVTHLRGRVEDAKAHIDRLIDKMRESRAADIAQIKVKLNDAKRKYTTAETHMNAANAISSAKTDKKLSELNAAGDALSARIAVLTKEIERISKISTCPTCLQKLSEAARDRVVQDKKKEIAGLKIQLGKIGDDIILVSRTAKATEEWESAGEYVASLMDDLKALETTKTESEKVYATELATLRRQHTKLTKDLADAQQQQYVYSFWAKGFSKSGVVSLLIDQAVEQLNEHIIAVSEELTGGLIVPQFNTTTATKSGTIQERMSLDVLIDGEISPYNSLSHSEQQRTDLVVMIAWQKLMEANAGGINIAFFDEVMEGLDEESVRSVLDYVSTKRAKLPTYLISHIPEQALHKPNAILQVYRDKDGSHVRKAK